MADLPRPGSGPSRRPDHPVQERTGRSSRL